VNVVLSVTRVGSPIGRLTLVAREGALVAIAFADREAETWRGLERRFGRFETEDHSDSAGAASALSAYFRGDLGALDAVQVDSGGTRFQRSVWSALREIPTGTTVSYSALAARIGRVKAVRAVGAANGSNPIPIVLPCHRVIAADGTLCGYGGGLDRKRWLLSHEGARTQTLPLDFT
jgi:methylated-DNA-[protein]-cysteine S-methyltransferase